MLEQDFVSLKKDLCKSIPCYLCTFRNLPCWDNSYLFANNGERRLFSLMKDLKVKGYSIVRDCS